MKVELSIDPECAEPKVVVYAARATPEIEALLRRLAAPPPDAVAAQTDRGVALLPVDEIVRVYSEAAAGVRADGRRRLRAPRAALRNGAAAGRAAGSCASPRRSWSAPDDRGHGFSLTGTIRLTLRGGIQTYVSRRRVSEIKKMFDVR